MSTVVFRVLRRNEIRKAAELAARAFDDYEYFTNWFPDKEERNRFQESVIRHEYLTNYGKADYQVALRDGAIAAVAQLNAPSYRKPSDLKYILNGWLSVYRTADKKTIDEWLSMDAAAGKPCHDYQLSKPDIWYVSSLTVEPEQQGTGIGSNFLGYLEGYVREKGGREIVFFTNSRKNLDFYVKRGYEVFDEKQIEHKDKVMGSWSLRKYL